MVYLPTTRPKSRALASYIDRHRRHMSVHTTSLVYRAWITEQIENLRNSTDDEANRKKIAELEDDLALRKAQISDLQQKILTADQGKTKCYSLPPPFFIRRTWLSSAMAPYYSCLTCLALSCRVCPYRCKTRDRLCVLRFNKCLYTLFFCIIKEKKQKLIWFVNWKTLTVSHMSDLAVVQNIAEL